MLANLLGPVTVLSDGTEEMKYCADCGEEYRPEDVDQHEPRCYFCDADSHSACRCPEFEWVSEHHTGKSDDGGGKAYGARDCRG